MATGVYATTYYVSNTGNNRYDGMSPSSSWQTLQRVQIAANSGLMKPGDKILFKRGDNFTGTLTWSSIFGNKAPSGAKDAPITFGAYGTGAKPVFQYHSDFEKDPAKKVLFMVAGVNYIIFDGLDITDQRFPKEDKVSPAYCAIAFNFGSYGDATSNHCIVRNCTMANIGMGIVLVGDSNTVDSCRFTDLKNVRNTFGDKFPENDDDYGANGVTITGNDNLITHNFFSGNWAESYDYGFSGGALESFGSSSRNRIMYNTIIDCNGVMEIGSGSGGMAQDNLIANNVLINNGGLTWVNISGTFAIQASNIQYFNNTIIDTENRYKDVALFLFNGKPEAETVFNIQNNVFYLSSGINITTDKVDTKKFTHENNVYEFKNGSTSNLKLSASELISTQPVFQNTGSKDPLQWNYQLTPAAKGRKAGSTVQFSGAFTESHLTGSAIPVTPAFATQLENAFYAVLFKHNEKLARWLMQIFLVLTGGLVG
ncbi:hypothetical protein EGI32_08645 [Ferruginibacter sp. HRS2-29]|nr:hypothetical protein [Ferruginibacter sp. HRS2-29]